MHGASEFGPDFQRVLVRTCVDDYHLRGLVTQFTREGQLGFTDPAAAWAWKILEATPYPSMLALQTEANRLPPSDPAAMGAQAILSSGDFRDRAHVSDQIVEWCRKQVFQSGFNAAVESWNAGKMDEAYTVMRRKMDEMADIRVETADRGWFFEEFDQRQARRQLVGLGMDYFPIGIAPIDRAMHGGLSYGELEVPLAYSGIGKSFYVNQRGFLGVRSRRKVMHFVLEGGRAKAEDRYEARFAETMYREVRCGNFTNEAITVARREYAIYAQGLVVRGFADAQHQWRISIAEIIAELQTLRRDRGWVPDLVIVDYGDLVHAEGKDEREKQKNAFRQLKGLAERVEFPGHLGYAVCAPSQAVRPTAGADDKEHVLKPRDVADCYEKVRVSDAIISLNRTSHEKANSRARVHLGKYRDAEDGITVRVETDYDHGAFSKLNRPEPPPLPPPAKGGAAAPTGP